MKKLTAQHSNEKGIGGILIISAVILIVIIVGVMIYFLLNGQKKDSASEQTNEQTQTEETSVSEDQVPLKICETGDPEECNDPVSNSDVDNIRSIEDD